MNTMNDIKLENILLQMAIEILDLTKTNDTIGTPIDKAKKAIEELYE